MKIFGGFDFVVRRLPALPEHVHLSAPSIATNKLVDPLKRPPTHKWTMQERTILSILDRWFLSATQPTKRTNNIDAIRRVFVLYFANSSLESRTTRAGLSNGAIASQLAEIWNEGLANPAWRNVYIETDFDDENGDWEVTRSELKDLAAEFGIGLKEKEYENIEEVSARRGNGLKKNKKKRKRLEVESGVLGNVVDYNDITEDDEMAVPKRRRKSTQKQNGLLTPPESPLSTAPRHVYSSNGPISSSRLQEMNLQQFALCRPSTPDLLETETLQGSPCFAIKSRQLIRKRPSKYRRSRPKQCSLAFRVWDHMSHGTNTGKGFRAGVFPLASVDPTSPPDHNSPMFRDAAMIHLTPLEKPSCFISITTSPLRPLHRCLQSTSNGKVAIIDLGYLKAHQPWSRPRFYYAGDIIRKLGIFEVSPQTGQKCNFRGAREVLVWGHIEPEAILAVFSKPDLLEYFRTHFNIRKVLRLATFQKVTNSYEYNKVLEKTTVKMDECTGYSLGHFLGYVLKLPIPHLQSTALIFAESYKFEGDQSSEKTFLAGVEAGYHAYLLQLLPIKDLPSVAVVIERPNKRWKGAEKGSDDFLRSRERIENVLGVNRY